MRLAAIAFLAGVLAVQQLPELPSAWWLAAALPFLLLAWARPAWLIGACVVFGVVWASVRAGWILGESLPRELEGVDLVVEGHIADIPQPAEYGQRFVFDIEHAMREATRVALPQRVLLTLRNPGLAPRAGERWRFTVRLTRPHGYQNPGGFDYEAHLLRNRIRARGYVRETPAAERLPGSAPRYAVDRLRQDLGERIRATLGAHPSAGIVVALANGDARGIPEAHWATLRATGTSHLVAISGLHISLIAAVVFWLARWLWALPGSTVLRVPAPLVGAACALVAASAYAALAGFVIPTQRALLMLAVALGGVFLRRRLPPSQLLAYALLAVLLFDPLAVLAPGFWLSFAAVAVIVFAMHAESGRPARWRAWGYLQWAIALGMLPLTLWLFQQASLVAPLANMLAVPVFDLLAVPLTLLGVGALVVLPDGAAHAPLASAAWLLEQLWQVLEWLAALPHAQWVQPRPPWWALLAGFIGVLWLLAPRGVPARWLGVPWLAALLFVARAAPGSGEVWFTLLDVGQGLSAVVRTQHHVLVFDTGPRYGPAFDTGEAVVLPYLRAQGVRHIDMLVISHGDNDHIGGADSVRRALPVGQVLSSVPAQLTGAAACAAGQSWRWDDVEFTLLNPAPGAPGRRNDDSCVLHVSSRYGRILLPGDIEARAERALLARAPQRLRADILVAPHHGSRSSSSCAFIDAVAPRYVFYPVGYRNRHQHPHPRVRARYALAGARPFDSATGGALQARLTHAGIVVDAYRVSARRYWFSD